MGNMGLIALLISFGLFLLLGGLYFFISIVGAVEINPFAKSEGIINDTYKNAMYMFALTVSTIIEANLSISLIRDGLNGPEDVWKMFFLITLGLKVAVLLLRVLIYLLARRNEIEKE